MDPVVLTVIGTGIALFAANWRVQAGWFAMMDKRFDAIDPTGKGPEDRKAGRVELGWTCRAKCVRIGGR